MTFSVREVEEAGDGELAAAVLGGGSEAGELGLGDGGARLVCARCMGGGTEPSSTTRCSAATNGDGRGGRG